jgi:hypothetical protein
VLNSSTKDDEISTEIVIYFNLEWFFRHDAFVLIIIYIQGITLFDWVSVKLTCRELMVNGNETTILANSISGVQSFSETSHEIGKETVLECSLVVTSGSDPSS